MTARVPSRLTTLRLAIALTLCSAVGLACGPVNTTGVMNDAQVAVQRAHAAEGEKFAVYETVSADLYLEKAKEEQGHAHYDTAAELAQHATELADSATERSKQQRGTFVPPSMPRATITHAPNEGQLAPAATPLNSGKP